MRWSRGDTCAKASASLFGDAVAWGYARAADALGVDIIENCEVTGILRDAQGRVAGVTTSRGTIRAARIGVFSRGSLQLLSHSRTRKERTKAGRDARRLWHR